MDAYSRGKGWGKIHPTFRWWAANLLAFTKFVGIGLLINQLGQVDLRAAPLNLRSSEPCPLLSLFPGCGWKKHGNLQVIGKLMYFC